MIHPNDGPSLLQSVWVKFQKDLQGSRKGWSEHNLTQTQKNVFMLVQQKMCLCVYMLENLKAAMSVTPSKHILPDNPISF